MAFYHDSHRYALAARARRFSAADLARELIEIAWEGLKRQAALNDVGDDETIYLKPLRDLVDQGKCPADLVLEKWEGELHHDIKKLIDYSAYRLP
jgi:glutamate--cysteine ligase